MATLIIVNNPKEWDFPLLDIQVVSAKSYLFEPAYKRMRYARVINLCKSYRYQTMGYYVSLLAAARGHKPTPSIQTIQDLKSQSILRVLSDDVHKEIEDSFPTSGPKDASIFIYFGKCSTKKHNKIASQLFKLLPAPLLRAQFHRNGSWSLQSVTSLSIADVPDEHRGNLIENANEYLSTRRTNTPSTPSFRFDLAILHSSTEGDAPSDEKALQKFIRAAEGLGIGAHLIEKDDFGQIAEFDGLFIRETTSVNHHTYRFARRANAEGLVVVDDPQSILMCTNKVYLAEVLEHNKIPTPKTIVAHKDNLDLILREIGMPCILKQPDSSFSQGVVRVDHERDLEKAAQNLLDKSDLLIAQEYMPTDFDWRVGIFDRKPLFVCRYHMAAKHWQIIKQAGKDTRYGKVDTMAVQDAPQQVVRMAMQAANLIGDSFYGVDIKQLGDQLYVIEINDNPSIDTGYEDAVLKSELYNSIMGVFLKRMERKREGNLKS